MLRGAAAAVSLPLLDVMSPRVNASEKGKSSSAVTPARLAYLYIPNGVADGAWAPEQTADSGELVKLNKWMKPLDHHSGSLTMFRNLWTPRGNGHIAGTATWLTGGSYDAQRLDAGGASVDQIAAKHFRNKTLLPSLELSSRGEGIFSRSLPRNTLSWLDSKTPAPRDIEPQIVFDRMFRGGQSGLGDASVLDQVLEDARALRRKVSVADRARIDEYLDSIRAIERRMTFARQQQSSLDRTPALKAAMVRPKAGIPDDHQQYVRTMLDMMVLAFWSDATRVCTYMLDHGQSNRYFNFIEGVRGTWHALSHWRDFSGRTEDDDGQTSWSSREEKLGMYNRVTQWHSEQVSYVLDRMSQIREPNGGSLLDHSMLVYGSSLADGHEHSEKNLPVLLAGGKNLQIKPGRLIHRRGVDGPRDISMSELHLALLQRLGVRGERFADAKEPLNLNS